MQKIFNYFHRAHRTRTFLLCLSGGAFMGLSYPPFKSWFLVYFGLAILLYLILNSDNLKQCISRAYLFLLVFNAITLYWISGWHSSDTFLKIGGVATVIIHPVIMLIPVILTYIVSRTRKKLALITFPFIWVGFEYFHNIWEFNFPWLELGNTESYNIHRIQYIEYTGVHGITFVICTISSLIYYLSSNLYTGNKIRFKEKTIYVSLITLIIFPNVFSYYRLSADNSAYLNFADKKNSLTVSMVQSNTDPFAKWGSDQMYLIDSYISKLNKGLGDNPDLMILHETATPFYFLEDYNAVKSQKFIDFVNYNNKYLLMGIPHLEYYSDSSSVPADAKK